MCQLMFLNKHVIVMLQSNVHDFLSIDEICVFEAFTARRIWVTLAHIIF